MPRISCILAAGCNDSKLKLKDKIDVYNTFDVLPYLTHGADVELQICALYALLLLSVVQSCSLGQGHELLVLAGL